MSGNQILDMCVRVCEQGDCVSVSVRVPICVSVRHSARKYVCLSVFLLVCMIACL